MTWNYFQSPWLVSYLEIVSICICCLFRIIMSHCFVVTCLSLSLSSSSLWFVLSHRNLQSDVVLLFSGRVFQNMLCTWVLQRTWTLGRACLPQMKLCSLKETKTIRALRLTLSTYKDFEVYHYEIAPKQPTKCKCHS